MASKSKLATEIIETLQIQPPDEKRRLMDDHEWAYWIAVLAHTGLAIPTAEARDHLKKFAVTLGLKVK